MSAKDQPGAAASGEDPAAAEAGEPVGASAAPEALSAKAMAKQLFDYLLGTFQAALFPDVLSDLGDVLVARGRRSVVLPGGHRAGPPGPFVRGGPALRPYRRGHIEDARDRTGRPRRLQAGLMQPGFAHTTNKSLPRPINLALPFPLYAEGGRVAPPPSQVQPQGGPRRVLAGRSRQPGSAA